ncbi:MAG: PTS sugar transporter subunit IIB [Elusimicrobiota bacterium]|jgi:mannose/fructose/N-acetylgalactosamine-specific phosphotransferase system component IIB
MTVELVRIDDRLVHGQVVEGWLKSLRISQVVVASDSVAVDETQQALYLLAVPQGVSLICLSLAETAAAWKKHGWRTDRTLILVSSPKDALRLLEDGAPLASVNVGGIHFKEGRVQILRAISLDDQDVAALNILVTRGVILEARPLPLDEPVDLRPYLEQWQQRQTTGGDQPR